MHGLLDLPVCVLSHIFSYLDQQSLLQLNSSCKALSAPFCKQRYYSLVVDWKRHQGKPSLTWPQNAGALKTLHLVGPEGTSRSYSIAADAFA